MLFLSQSQFEKLIEKGGKKALANAYVIVLSHENITIDDEELGSNEFVTLVPAKESIEAVVNGDLDKKEFLKEYKKSLRTYQNRFLAYTIARSFNESKYLPIFVCSDSEFELGYIKVLKKYLEKSFGMKSIKLKQYLKAVKTVSKEVKGLKKSKRNKAFIKGMRNFVKDTCQISLEGLEKLEKEDRKFAIDRIVLLINQSEDPMETVSKKAVIQSISAFAETKKGKKLVKRNIKLLDLSKKSDRWSRSEAFRLAQAIYNELHGIDDQSGDED